MQVVLILLTFCRGPLAFFFLSPSTTLRVLAVTLAILSDCIDGYLARLLRSTSRLGAILDPIMDKFFVYFVLTILTLEGKIALPNALFMVSRDIALIVFALYLVLTNQFCIRHFRAIILGKISTALQFAVIVALCLGVQIREPFYLLFIFLAMLALIELFWYQLRKVKS